MSSNEQHSTTSTSAGTGTGTEYEADADMQAVLDAHAALGSKPIEALTPSAARKQPSPADAVKTVLKNAMAPAEISEIESVDQTIPGPTGPLPVRIYKPVGAGPFPVIVYFHGGGWVLANKDVYDGGARGIAQQVNAVVVSVDYRLAPEAKFPAQHDDALATYQWAIANALAINGDPLRLAIGGESAGGNLAIATAIAARDLGLITPLHVLSVYPIAQATNMSTPSYLDCEHAKPLNKAMMGWFAAQVFSSTADAKDPRIDLLSANLKDLPPITLINARIDPLRSDGDLLAAALKTAGVSIEHKIYEGVTHEFFGMASVVTKAKQAQLFAGEQLKQSLGAAPRK